MKNIRFAATANKVAEWLRSQKILVIGVILVAVLAVPRSSPAQFLPSPCCVILSAGLGSVSGAINNVIGSGLNTIRSKHKKDKHPGSRDSIDLSYHASYAGTD